MNKNSWQNRRRRRRSHQQNPWIRQHSSERQALLPKAILAFFQHPHVRMNHWESRQNAGSEVGPEESLQT